MNPHAKRLHDSMAEIRQRGYFTRLEPSSILIETRRLLEHTNLRSSFPVAVLYADWCAHTRLNRTGAGAVLLEITERLNRTVRDSSNASNSAVCDAVCSVLALRTLQSQLVDLYGRFGIETSALVAPQLFRQFIGAILDTIAGHPLEFPKNVARKRDSVRKAYEAACRVARDDPRWIVTHCSVTKELSDEQLAFYAVTSGTYIWQIGVAAGYFLCGLL